MASIINPGDYSVVWLCPLPIETTAALFMFDEHHEGVINRQHGQTVEYHFGRIGRHNVAIASFPSGEVGIGKAGAMAEAVARDFKNLELGLLVGIGAAIPSQDRDIRLGDVAVADPVGHYPGVVAYDMVKVVTNEELQKQWMDATHPLWRSVISKIRACATVRGYTFHEHLKVFDKPEAKIFQKPYDPPPLHPAFGNHCRETDGPIVHYGTILSGNKVIRATEFRDQLKEKYGDPVALEMEAAGVMTSLPVAVVRGISDSADSLKNDEWHARAAAVAAGYAKEMLLQLSPKSPPSKTRESEGKVLLRGQLPKPWDFRGREDHLKTISMHLDRGRQKPFEKSVLIISGLSGAGKSQLASAYVKSQLAEDSGREIFWTNGRDRKTFETSIVQFYRDPKKPQVSTQTQVTEDTDRQSVDLIESFLQELNRPGNTGWLMVVDDMTLWSQDGDSTEESANLSCYLDRIQHGSLLITTNHHNWLTSHENVLPVEGLDDTSAMSLLKSKLYNHSTRDSDLHELSRMLHGLPLSLRLAITYIRKRGIKVVEYVNMWKERKLDDSLSLIEPNLVQTLTLCFEELQLRDTNAANLLTLFGFLDHRNLSFDLCQKAKSPNLPRWLSAIGNDRNQFDKAIEALLDLSFVQLNNDEIEVATYSIHPAVHAYARNRAGGSKEGYISWAVSLIADNVPRSLDKDYWKKAQALAPHADQCMVYIRARKFQPQNLERMGALFRFLGRYEDASQLYKVVLRCLLPHRAFLETVAQVLNDLGLVYYGQRKFELAVKTFRDSIGAYYQLPRPLQNDSADTLMCIIFNHGNACRMVRDLNPAVAAFNHVYDFFDRRKGNSRGSLPSWIEILASRALNALGEIYLERKETRSAMTMLQSALSTQNRYLDSIHPIVLSTKMNLGRAYTDLESYSEACELLRDVARKYREQWGAGHYAAVTAADELARASMGYGQIMRESSHSGNMGDEALKEAERLWLENLSFYGEKYGVNSEDALRTKANIALLQAVTGDLAMARRNMLQVFQRSTIPAQKVKAQCNLALICQQMGDLDVAGTNFGQAVEASKLLIEPNRTHELFRSMYHQAQLYSSLGDRDSYLRILRDLNTLQPAEHSKWQERAWSELALADDVSSQNRSDPQGTSQDQLPLEQRSRKRKWQMD